MKNLLIILLCLTLGASTSYATTCYSSSSSNIEYSQEVIQSAMSLGELAAEGNLRLFNEYSCQLDMVLFGYYSESYNERKDELNTATGGGSGTSQPDYKTMDELMKKIEN